MPNPTLSRDRHNSHDYPLTSSYDYDRDNKPRGHPHTSLRCLIGHSPQLCCPLSLLRICLTPLRRMNFEPQHSTRSMNLIQTSAGSPVTFYLRILTSSPTQTLISLFCPKFWPRQLPLFLLSLILDWVHAMVQTVPS